MSTSRSAGTRSVTNKPLSCCSVAAAPANPAASACCAPSSRSSSSRKKLSFFGNAVLREIALRDTLY